MAEPFLAEIRVFSFNFAPQGWALCNGQLLPINQNQGLFSLLGTTYGGNGQTNFALPDLRGRTPMHLGGGHTQGEMAGQESHTVSMAELPTHTHAMNASGLDTAGTPVAVGNVLSQGLNVYAPPSSLVALHPQSVSSTGGSQAHNNMMPSLTLNLCIALQGIFPSQN